MNVLIAAGLDTTDGKVAIAVDETKKSFLALPEKDRCLAAKQKPLPPVYDFQEQVSDLPL